MRDNSKTTIYKAMDISDGLTANSMKVSGNSIKCTERETFSGPTDANIKANTTMARKKAMESLFGQMEGYTEVSGETVNKTVEESSSAKMEHREQAYGAMGRRFVG